MLRPPPRSTLFPSTTLFRSGERRLDPIRTGVVLEAADKHLRQLHVIDLEALTRVGSRPHKLHRVEVAAGRNIAKQRSEEHTSELQSLRHLVCRLLLEKKKSY